MNWVRMTVRLRPETYEAVLRKSQLWGLSPAETVRAILEHRALTPATTETVYVSEATGERIKELFQNILSEIQGVRLELNRIGCNLNQLAHLQHLRRLSERSKGYYEKQDYENKIAALEEQMAQGSDLKEVQRLINQVTDAARVMGGVVTWLRT